MISSNRNPEDPVFVAQIRANEKFVKLNLVSKLFCKDFVAQQNLNMLQFNIHIKLI